MILHLNLVVTLKQYLQKKIKELCGGRAQLGVALGEVVIWRMKLTEQEE
jgi:hypothetical protein